ncbi:SprT-like domain-containing protein [Spiroplasma endosymbiont of Panorpa germanica]|uniref:SprT-like domain-containing protein n=1 Tax=Spiroplasma endosymbiont of Panorpa germanica TaxID=3066314 RepID=UPI0030D51C37
MKNFDLMIPDVLNEIYLAHDYLNNIFFNNELQKIQITITSNNKKSRKNTTLGYFNPKKTWEGDFNEIVLLDSVFTGDENDVFQTLAHEMVHQYCFENNIKDCESNGRHNKNFKNFAEQIGLTVNKPKSKNSGYTTSLNSHLKDVFKKMPLNHQVIRDFVGIRNFKNTQKDEIENREFKQLSYKYLCQGCEISFRSKIDMDLSCNKCELNLIKSVN